MTDFPDEPTEAVGRELYQFFVELLSPRNLSSYGEERQGYINSRRGSSLIGDVAKRVLETGSLEEIEANVAMVTSGSGGPPIVICIVYPPWGV